MKPIEVLLKIDTGKKFDTPKKLNRSTQQIKPGFADQVEAGEMTSEMIDVLSVNYPVFYYRTCITIHGSWPEIERTRIGGYKNIHQNQNGSLEIYYSAIDTGKIDYIREQLRGTNTPFRFERSSTGRRFYMAKPVTRDTIQQVKEELQPIAEELAALNIYGSIQIYVSMDLMGRLFLVLSMEVLAVPYDEQNNVVITLSRLTREEHEIKRAQYIQEQAQEERKRKEESQAIRQSAEAQKASQEAQAQILRPQLAHLKECTDIKAGTLVKVGIDRDLKACFVYYRYNGAGAFGRVKWSQATSEILTDDLQWRDRKQEFLKEINARLKGTRLMTAKELPKGYTKSKPGQVSGYLTNEQVKAHNMPAAIHERKILAVINY